MQPGYRFNFVNRDGSVDTFEIGRAEDDADAALRARAAMLVSLTAVAVEVWKDDLRLCRLRRDSVLAPASPATYALRAGDGRPPSAMAVSA